MNKLELIQALEKLSKDMFDVGVEMNLYGGMTETAEHGLELVGASKIASSWVDTLRDKKE